MLLKYKCLLQPSLQPNLLHSPFPKTPYVTNKPTRKYNDVNKYYALIVEHAHLSLSLSLSHPKSFKTSVRPHLKLCIGIIRGVVGTLRSNSSFQLEEYLKTYNGPQLYLPGTTLPEFPYIMFGNTFPLASYLF